MRTRGDRGGYGWVEVTTMVFALFALSLCVNSTWTTQAGMEQQRRALAALSTEVRHLSEEAKHLRGISGGGGGHDDRAGEAVTRAAERLEAAVTELASAAAVRDTRRHSEGGGGTG
eukprot:Hpha_TRINITY_DN16931_c0_g6::TRINITY_DN16931_c0_g6_i1::g.53432::m.53432